jgi:hypothetical protein
MIDILSAMSAVITVIAILYTLWYDDIEKVMSSKLPPAEKDRDLQKRQNRKVWFFRAFPLFIISAVFFLMFLPEVRTIVISSLTVLKTGTYVYNPIKAAVVFIDILGLTFMILTAWNIYSMRNKCW